jgi:hypothetical protein
LSDGDPARQVIHCALPGFHFLHQATYGR